MENSPDNKVSSVWVELVEKIIRLYLEYSSKLTLRKTKLAGVALTNLLLLSLLALGVAISCWWCCLGWVSLLLYNQKLPWSLILLVLIFLNGIFLGLLLLIAQRLKKKSGF